MIPGSLRIVALIQLLGGIVAAIGMVVQQAHGHLNLDFAVLGIPIYFGLMHLESGWRTCALVFIWAGMIVTPLVFVLGLDSSTPAYVQLFGIQFASLSSQWLSVAAVVMFLVNLWQYRVLTRQDIRDAFLRPAVESPAGQGPQLPSP